jgi:photosystem II CP47 chlorophyll apoprotein
MLLYELIILDPTDSLYNPIWRQGSYVLEFCSRIGVVSSLFSWELSNPSKFTYWSFEIVVLSHLLLAGWLILASFWHWSFWDLDLFLCSQSSKLVLDLNKIFGIHLLLASVLCFGYGFFHVSGIFGPGIWCSDSFGLLGTPRSVKPFFSISSLSNNRFGVIASHHIIAGIFALLFANFHIISRPQTVLFYLLRMGSIESVLASSIISVSFSSSVNSALLWYGGVVSPLELLGPSRYQWDNSYFSQEIDRKVKIFSENFPI